MDSLALRQILGLAAVISSFPCFSCLLADGNIDNMVPTEWKAWHTQREYRRLAKAWLEASSESQRERLFKESRIRWSELSRLSYIDIPKMAIIDPMHTFQNLCRNLVTDDWGMDPTELSGDSLFVGSRPALTKPVSNSV